MNAYIVSSIIIGIALIVLISMWYGNLMYQQGVQDERLGVLHAYNCPEHGKIVARVPLDEDPPGEIPCTHDTLRRLDTQPVQHKIERCSHAAKRAP